MANKKPLNAPDILTRPMPDWNGGHWLEDLRQGALTAMASNVVVEVRADELMTSHITPSAGARNISMFGAIRFFCRAHLTVSLFMINDGESERAMFVILPAADMSQYRTAPVAPEAK